MSVCVPLHTEHFKQTWATVGPASLTDLSPHQKVARLQIDCVVPYIYYMPTPIVATTLENSSPVL